MMFLFAPSMAALLLCGVVAYGLLLAAYPPLRQISLASIVWGARRDSHFLETLRSAERVIHLDAGRVAAGIDGLRPEAALADRAGGESV